MKPVKAQALWKYETDSLRLFQPGPVIIFDPDTDSRSGITGTQNRVIFRGLKYQAAAERVNVIFPESDINDNEQVVRWVPKKSTTTIDDAGGISDSDTSVIVNKPTNATLFVPDTKRIWAVKIDNEFVVITSVASSVPDGSHDTWTIKRGRHGTTAAAHGDGNTCRLYGTFPDMGVIPLTSSNVALDVPSALSATAYAGYIDVAWTHGLDDTEIKQLHSFILYYSDSTIAVFDPNVDSLPGGVTRLELTKSPRHIFADQTYIKKYFKVTSMNLSGVESALSSEVSATATQPPLPVVNAKPDPPTIGLAGNGGTQASGFHLLFSVQISGSPGDAGVTKLQYQIGDFDAAHSPTGGDPPPGGFTSNRTQSHAGVDIDKVEAGHEFVGTVVVPLSSAASGGKYQLTARVFNGSGGGWSNWSTPVTSSTIGGLPDQGAPGSTGAVFKARDTPETDGGSGNNVTFELGLPSTGANTVYGFQIQGADATGDWTSTVQGQLSLLDRVEYGAGDIVDGGIVINNLSVGLTASAHVGEVVFVYESVVVSRVGEGKITGIAGLNLITANSTTSITVKPHGGVGYKKTATGIGFLISSGFNHYDFHFLDQLLPQFGGIAEQVGHLYRISFQISKALFYRMRWLGPETHGEWFYVKSGTDGTTNKATATKFTPSKLVASALSDKFQMLIVAERFASILDLCQD